MTAIQTVKKQAIQKPTPAPVQEFKPTRAMLRWLEATDELGPHAPIKRIAKQAGVNRDNWYQWMRNQQFVEWWDKQWETSFKLHRWKLKAIGLKQAENDHAWWHDMMVVMGELPGEDQKSPAGPQVTNAFQFNLTDEQLKRIVED